jgi:hypothetical protein
MHIHVITYIALFFWIKLKLKMPKFLTDLITWVCLELNARALVSSWKVENLDNLNVGWLGVFITPTTKLAVWWRLLSHGAPDSSVRHRTLSGAPATSPHHLAEGFRPLELCLVAPPGCPVAHRTSPVDCPVCHPRVLCPLRAGTHLMRCSRPLREK